MDSMDEVIIALYARGLSTWGIQEKLKEMYGAGMSSTLISHATYSVLEEVQDWQARVLDAVYTTHAIESLNYSLRKIIRGAGPVRPPIREDAAATDFKGTPMSCGKGAKV